MSTPIPEKYEYYGPPSLTRPDLDPPDGWSLSLITSIQRIYNHRLSADDRQVAFFWHREDLADLYIVPIDGGWPERWSSNRPSQPYWLDETPQWSPDGRWLAFSIDGSVHVVDSQGGLPRKIKIPLKDSTSPVWLADSNRMVISVTVDDTPRLYLTDRRGTFARALTSDPGHDFDARPSPDGRTIAYVHWPDSDLNRRDIRLVDVESGEVHLLSGSPKVKDWEPRWSADGEWIAFLSQRTEFNQIWLIRPSGEDLRQLTDLGRDIFDPAWSPSGRQIACTIKRGGRRELALIEAKTGAINILRSDEGVYAHPNWSQDGNFLTVEYESPTQPPDIYRLSLRDNSLTALTFSNPPAMRVHSLVTPEEIVYRSDDLDIHGMLYKPRHPNGAGLVLPHGGPAEAYEFYWDVFPQYLVAKGYTMLMPNYRGSTGHGMSFEHTNYNDWGGGDVRDCLNAADFLARLDWIDPLRIGIFGESYGGYLTNCCLITDLKTRFACGISIYGDADLFTSWAQCNVFIQRYTEMQIGHPASNRQAYEAGTVIGRVDNIRKPLLLLHGLADDIVPPQASEELAQALRRAGKTYEYKTYADEPHGFQKRANLMDALERMERFFDWYLMIPPNVQDPVKAFPDNKGSVEPKDHSPTT